MNDSKRRMRYREMVGKVVMDVEGHRVGRVEDMLAARRGDRLCVTGLMIGPTALLERIGLLKRARISIDWNDIQEVGRVITLRAGWKRPERIGGRRT